MAIDTLLPKKLEKSDASYKSVIELNEALSSAEKERIRNIALTGPFGSGKSSVLITLREDFAKDYKFLPISLATLQANEGSNTMRIHRNVNTKATGYFTSSHLDKCTIFLKREFGTVSVFSL